MYSIKQLADLSGVSTRTLRYYDQIDLLKPNAYTEAGYRLYDTNEVDLLQQILFFRALDFPLEKIREIISQPQFDQEIALKEHYLQLIAKQTQLEKLIQSVEKTIQHHKGEKNMTDNEKFTAFKKNLVAENEQKYGQESREKYGEETVEKSKQKMLQLSEKEYHEMQTIEEELFVLLNKLSQNEHLDLTSPAAKKVYTLHKNWLAFSWHTYSKEAHAGLAEMYLADPRFTAYYDEKVQPNATKVLHDIILYYAK